METHAYSSDNQNNSLLSKLADSYFRPKWFEKSGTLYEALGVRTVKSVVMSFYRTKRGEDLKHQLLSNKPSVESLSTYEKRTRFNECVHGIGMLFQSALLIRGIVTDHDLLIASSFFLSSLEASLVMLQRYNREKIYRIRDRIFDRDKTLEDLSSSTAA